MQMAILSGWDLDRIPKRAAIERIMAIRPYPYVLMSLLSQSQGNSTIMCEHILEAKDRIAPHITRVGAASAASKEHTSSL